MVFRGGATATSKFFLLKYVSSPDGEDKISVVVPQKIAKTSVERHRLKRKIVGAISNVANINGILIAQKALIGANSESLKKDFKLLCEKIKYP